MSHPNENTKSGPEQDQPEVLKQESPRKCKICGGPNHYGCGCEAKQRAAAVIVSTEKINNKLPSETDTVDLPKPEQPAASDEMDDVFSPDAIREAHEANMDMAQNIKTMSDCFETVLVACYDINNYLKLIAGDLITIRYFLTKEDEVKNAPENKD